MANRSRERRPEEKTGIGTGDATKGIRISRCCKGRTRREGGAEPVALVTGASRGLGREIALRLGSQGYAVVVNHSASGAGAQSVVDSLGERALAIQADVGDVRQVERMAREISRAFGRLDAVINNAGITSDKLLLRQTEQEWDDVLRTNLKGPFAVMRSVVPIMKSSGGGHIVNVASFAGLRGKVGQAAYSASKAALIGLTMTAAREFSGGHIRVNALIPGYMETAMGCSNPEALDIARKRSLLGELTDAAEVAQFVLFLLMTVGITGQVFSLDSRIT